jgi:flagellar basal body rod protein FlgG
VAVNPVLSTGISGIQYGLRGVDQAAHEIATMNHEVSLVQGDGREASPHDVGDAAEAVVSMQTYQRQVEASAKVVKTADAVIGMLIDTVA